MSLSTQIAWALVLSVPVACIAWTVTHEEVLRELREYFLRQSRSAPQLWKRKFYYLFTCEYCFSHYVALLFLVITHYKLLYPDWRGYVVAFFTLVWVANIYISGFGRLRLDIKKERLESTIVEQQAKKETGEDTPGLHVAA